MKLALGLDVQTNAKGGKFMSIEDSHQGALVCKADVEVLWEPGNFQDDGAKRVGVCFASNTDLGAWTDGVEQAVVDDMIIFQKPFPGVTRAELESQLQRAVKVSAKGKHVKCKMDLERCLFWDSAGNRVPRPAEFARRRGRALVEARHVWLMARHTYRWRSVRWQDSRSRRTRLWSSLRGSAGWPAAAPGSSAACRCPASLRPAPLPPRPQRRPWVFFRRPR